MASARQTQAAPPPLALSTRGRLACIGVVAVSLGALFATEGTVAVALGPAVLVVLAWAMGRAPMRISAHLLLFLALLVDNPIERPGQGLYESPLLPVGRLLYDTLNKSLHLSGLKVTGLEAWLLMLMAMAGLRMLIGDRVDGSLRIRAAAPFLRACVLAVGTLVAWWLYGVATGGSVPHAIFQIQALLFLPLMAMFFAYAFKQPSDLRAIMRTFLIVGVFRALMCVYYFLTVTRNVRKGGGGQSGDGSYVTTHSDSILAAVAIVICVAAIYQDPRPWAFVRAALVVPVVALGILLNNRRIAFVAVGLGLFFSYQAAAVGFRRRVQRTVLTVLPLLLLYVAVGWSAHGSWAKPVQTFRSVLTQKDNSSATRDIENFNLIQTLRRRPVAGWGFGHEYIEAVKAFDISKIFEAYRFVPHNSFLWLWGACGLVGFTLYWMCLSVGLFFAARACLGAQTHNEALMAMTAISATIAYMVQGFGDMGMMSWMGSLMVAASLGACASMATRSGAWVNHDRRRAGQLPLAAGRRPQ